MYVCWIDFLGNNTDAELSVLSLTFQLFLKQMLSRLLQYAQDLGERGFPQMNYDTWKHIAVKKVPCMFMSSLHQWCHELHKLILSIKLMIMKSFTN